MVVLLDESGTQSLTGFTQPFSSAFHPGLLKAFGQNQGSRSLCCSVLSMSQRDLRSEAVKFQTQTNAKYLHNCSNISVIISVPMFTALICALTESSLVGENCDYFHSEHVQATCHQANLLCSQLSLCVRY